MSRQIGREEVRSYGGEILRGRVLDVTRTGDGRFRLELSGGHGLLARRVLVATGVADELPAIPGLGERWGREVISCPFCHGWEVRDQRVVQILTHPMGLHPTPILRHLTSRLTLVLHDADGVDTERVDQLASAGVEVVRERVERVEGDSGGPLSVRLEDGTSIETDAILAGTRFGARVAMLHGLGVEPVAHPSGLGDHVDVDPMGATSVPGVFAAGNVTDPSLQVLPSAAHGSRVGAAIAFSLAEEDLHDGVRPSGARADWDLRYGGEDPVWSANPNGTLVREAEQSTPGTALDVGAGEGADAIWLAERGWTATANDISPAALQRVAAEADRRGLQLELLAADANDVDAFGGRRFDLVSLQYGSFLRTPEQLGARNLLGAVAPGGTLLVVSHDLAPMRDPVDVATQTRMYDPEAYVGVEEIHRALLAAGEAWRVETYETRDRPPGAASSHHVSDVVLRAVRVR